MLNTHQRCETCRFFTDQISTISTGQREDTFCLRYPPQIAVSDPIIYSAWLFPSVHETSRCGEWRPILENGNISAYEEE